MCSRHRLDFFRWYRGSIATTLVAQRPSLRTEINAGSTTIPVTVASGFSEGQTITIDSGANAETAVVASIARFPAPAIHVKAGLKQGHAAHTQISGTGITLSAPLVRAHAIGAQVTDNAPTPGAPNRYYTKR